MSSSDVDTIDTIASNLIKCYQIQDLSNPKPIYIGSYENVPLLTHIVLDYDGIQDTLKVFDKASNSTDIIPRALNQTDSNKSNQYRIHVSSYILPEESLKSNSYKIAGLIIQKNNHDISTNSLDLAYNSKSKKYEYIFCDHLKDEARTIETLSEPFTRSEIIPNLVQKIYEEPIKSILLS